jgi:hypothetical protein
LSASGQDPPEQLKLPLLEGDAEKEALEARQPGVVIEAVQTPACPVPAVDAPTNPGRGHPPLQVVQVLVDELESFPHRLARREVDHL